MHDISNKNSQVQFLPGQPMLSTQDLPWLVGNSAARISRFFFWLKTTQRSRSLQWLLVNSFQEDQEEEEEDGPQPHTSSFPSPHLHRPRVFQVGPLSTHTKTNPSFWDEDRSCLDWLSKQELGSVVYVSFGSWVGPIGDGKVAELALGLEAVRMPFIWVLGPTWRGGLPEGYLERVASHGKIVAWAPQREVLEHQAVGCYLTHCGWNSTLEAIECRKPLVCYPVAGDQFVNCAYIVNVWKIGVRVAGPGQGAVEEGLRRVMTLGAEGGEMRRRAMELKERITREDGCGGSKAVAGLAAFLDELEMVKNDKKKNNNRNKSFGLIGAVEYLSVLHHV